MVVVDAEEVVEVASHVLGGVHRGGDVHRGRFLGERWEDAGQNGLLDLTGHGQVALDACQLVVLLLHRLDVVNLLDGLLDGHAEVVEVDGLRGEVEGTVVHCLADVAHVAVGRHHDALQGGVLHLVDLR